MPLVELIIDESEEQFGIEAISLVEEPAIEVDFITLSKQQKLDFKAIDDERKVLFGAVMIPDKKILRVDEETGQHYEVVFSRETCRKALQLFFKHNFQNNTTEHHKSDLEGNTVFEAWEKEHDVHDKSVAFGCSDPIGTIYISMKVTDEDYAKAKSGEFKGFSLEGWFKGIEVKASKDFKQTIKEILED